MDPKDTNISLLRKQLYVGIFIAIVVVGIHAVASDLAWYWILDWFDIPMHIFGGVLAGYFGLFCYAWLKRSKNGYGASSSICVALGAALGIGIVWECIEYAFGLSGLSRELRFDTLADIVNDMIGGVISLIIWDLFIKKSKGK